MGGKPALLAMFFTSIVAFLYYWIMEGLLGGTVARRLSAYRLQICQGGYAGLKAP